MTPKERAAARENAVRAAMMLIRAIEVAQGVTRQSIADMRDVLIELARRRDLFPLEDFPPSEATTERNSLFEALGWVELEDQRAAASAALAAKVRAVQLANGVQARRDAETQRRGVCVLSRAVPTATGG